MVLVATTQVDLRVSFSRLYGLVVEHGINPFDYLNDLFTRLPAAKITQIKDFTPAAWAKARERIVARAA
jgi:hypothetical protein